MLTALRERERVQLGRDPTSSVAVVDSQSVRASERGGLHGYDGGKKASGIKRHLLVDIRGTVLITCVSLASVGDRDGAAVLFARVADAFPRLQHVGGPGLPRRRLSRLGSGSHWHHRGNRAAPRWWIPLRLGPGGYTTAGSAALRCSPAALGG
jgi:hypothetical protein